MTRALEVENLVTSFAVEGGRTRVLDGVSFHIDQGETLGVVGESGCGKSVTGLSIMRLLPKPAGKIESGKILLRDKDLTTLTPHQMHHLRGKKIAMIFQEPMTALNPVKKIGAQMAECFYLHFPGFTESQIKKNSIELLEKVGVSLPEKRLEEYPHQLSGGIRQRVMIAMALACKPELLIADEPTTALDVTIQAQILQLLKDLQKEYGMAMIFITHDLGVIAEISDRVVVMYSGQVVETGTVYEIFDQHRHPYTRGLLGSIPDLDTPSKSRLKTIEGMVPDFAKLPMGCRFQNRCDRFEASVCAVNPIELRKFSETENVRCVRVDS